MDNIFFEIEKHLMIIIGLSAMVIVIVSAVYLISIPEKGFVFEGTITRIELNHIVVHVRNNATVNDFNSTVSLCYDEPYRFVCDVGDRVEITQYTSWFDEVWAITAIVV